MPAHGYQQLTQRIDERTATVGVIGLGYVGLPLIGVFHRAGFATLGFDVDPRKIDSLLKGRSYIRHIPHEEVARFLAEGRFDVTTDMSRLAEADVILICVPTPLSPSRDPDLQFVESTARSIAKALRPGQLVVLESTTYPGTTREVVVPILETSGLRLGKDFFVAFSPEREDPGNTRYQAQEIPKVVGGIDRDSRELAAAIYGAAFAKVIPVSSCEVAEACKILENTYRCVNIALVNECKLIFERLGINVWEVIEAAQTKPFGFQAFFPGPGLGGHCIPIDPFYLSWVARRAGLSTRFVELAGEVNTKMPEHVIQRVASALNDQGKALRGSRICVLGLAYKKDVDDPRESPSLELLKLLQAAGAITSFSDPYIPRMPSFRRYHFPEMVSQELTPAFLQSQDLVLISTDHSDFDYDAICRHSHIVVDTRNATRNVRQPAARIYQA